MSEKNCETWHKRIFVSEKKEIKGDRKKVREKTLAKFMRRGKDSKLSPVS